jgi:tRNA-modifying protein YgfZ
LADLVSHDLFANAALLVGHGPSGIVRVTGADRGSWLQGLLTNDVQAIGPGQGCYAAWLTPQGRMLTDAVVLADEHALTIEVPAALVEALVRQLEAAIFAEDVALSDETGVWRTIGVYGARAAEVIARSTVGSRPSTGGLKADALAAWQEHEHAPLPHAGTVVGVATYGVPGFVLRVPAEQADLWTSRLRLAGGTLAAPDAIEFARIEVGRPRFLVDMDADTIPLEAGLEHRAISFSKGCYVGQEVIVRVLHRGGGRVAKRLVGLAIDGPDVPVARAAVKIDAEEVGRVTSAAWSPRLLRTVALAYVRRDSADPGTRVTVSCDGAGVPAVVKAFPIE